MYSRRGQGSGQSTPRQMVNSQQQEGQIAAPADAASVPPPLEKELVPPIPGTVQQVHWLLNMYNLKPSNPPATLKQCSSSLFVLMCRRLLNAPLAGIHLQPDTYQKRIENIRVVLSAMESIRGKKLEFISAHEIVMLNETHIGYLVALFVELAQHIYSIQQPGVITAPPPSSVPGYQLVAAPHPSEQVQPGGVAGIGGGAPGVGGADGVLDSTFEEEEEPASEIHPEEPSALAAGYEGDVADTYDEADEGDGDGVTEVTEEDEEPHQRIEKWKSAVVPPGKKAKYVAHAAQMSQLKNQMEDINANLDRFQQLYRKPTAAAEGGRKQQPAAVRRVVANAEAAVDRQTTHGSKLTATHASAATGKQHLRKENHHIPAARPKKSGVVTYNKDGIPMGKRHYSGFNMMANLPSPLKSVSTGLLAAPTASPQQQDPNSSTDSSSFVPRMTRDEKIAHLRNQKLIGEAQREVESGLRSQYSLAEASMAEFGRSVQKQRRRDLADLKKFAKDDDALQRQAYMKVISNRKQKMLTKAWLAKEEMYFDPPTSAVLARRSYQDGSLVGTEGHLSDEKPTDIVLAAKKALAEYAEINQADMVAEYQRYRDSLSEWKESVQI